MSREGDEKERREQLGMEPTIPATEVKGVLPDFASERSAPDNGGGGRSMPWVVGALVVGVAGVFWWMSPKPVPPAPAPATAVAPPVTPVAPPTAKPAAKPAVTKPPPPPPPVPTAPAPSAPAAAPTSPSVVAAKPSAPPAHHKRPHHKKASAKAKPVKLPRLPSPPPAD